MIAGLLLLAAAGLPAQAAAPHVLVVTGVGGEARYSASFVAQAEALIAQLTNRYAVPREQVTWLTEDPARTGGRAAGRSTRERLGAELAALAGRTGADDRVLLVFIGHGSDAGEPRLNLPGPDIGAGDLATLLGRLPARQVAVIVAASASGGFVDRLQAPGRLVITATRSGLERNETRFGTVLGEALAGDAADLDKDGRLSLLEVFGYVSREVARGYQAENRLQTEHARLSDSTLARRFVLTPADRVITAAPGDSVTAGLLARKAELERRIDALRARRDELPADRYERELEELLVDLARISQALRERTTPP